MEQAMHSVPQAPETVEMVPEGFVVFPAYGEFGELSGPVYHRSDSGGKVLGLRVLSRHGNRMGVVHGGMVCTLLDTAMAYACRRALEAKSQHSRFVLVTTQLSVNFLGNAREGDWLETHTRVLQSGRRLSFAESQVRLGERVIAQASGQFMLVEPQG
jgi:uncharacterized protein (TIGR00369 family)